MSLVENLVNQIATQGLSGVTKPQSLDMTDDTFAKLFEKQLNSSVELNNNLVGQMGAPAGLVIEPFNNTDFSETVQNQLEIIGESKLTKEHFLDSPIEIKDIDMGDFFSNLLKTSDSNNSDFLNFAKRQASNAYGAFGKTYVTDVEDFVDDITSMI